MSCDDRIRVSHASFTIVILVHTTPLSLSRTPVLMLTNCSCPIGRCAKGKIGDAATLPKSPMIVFDGYHFVDDQHSITNA